MWGLDALGVQYSETTGLLSLPAWGAAVAVALIVILFVLFMSWPHIPDSGVRIVSLLAAAAVLIFNTASIAAMVKNYAADKDFIYGLDIKTLDESRKKQG